MASKAQPILPSQVRRAEYGRTVYTATLADGIAAADVKKSDFWIHMAPTLQDLDRIEAITADGETFIELLVARVERINDGTRTVRIPKVVVLHEVKLGAESKAARESNAAVADATSPNLYGGDGEADAVLRGVRPAGPKPDVQSPDNAAVDAADGEGTNDEDGDGVADGYSVKYGGPTHKYRVLKDGVTEPLAAGMTKKEAIAWANSHAEKSA